MTVVGLSAMSTFGFAGEKAKPIKALIITGDNVGAHDWKGTTQVLRDILAAQGLCDVDATTSPSKDLTDENLAKYDVLVLNYKDTPQGSPESRWSEANKEAFLKAVKSGKGLVVAHFASAAFTKPNWTEFEKAIAGGWRSQGFHGPKHAYVVKMTDVKHPITAKMPEKFDHAVDELYQNSLLTPDSVVIVTAYSDPSKPRGTGKDEAVVWVNQYGDGRVCNIGLGHDAVAMGDPHYRSLLRNAVQWTATGKVE